MFTYKDIKNIRKNILFSFLSPNGALWQKLALNASICGEKNGKEKEQQVQEACENINNLNCNSRFFGVYMIKQNVIQGIWSFPKKKCEVLIELFQWSQIKKHYSNTNTISVDL